MNNKLHMLTINTLNNGIIFVNPININYLYLKDEKDFYIVIGNDHILLPKEEFNNLFENYIKLD